MSTKLWGGRFSKEVDASITGWTESVTIDSKMVVEDIWGSMAHVSMLGVKGIIPPKDAAAILSKLLEFQDGYVAGSWQLQLEHMNVEARLIDALSIAIGGKMHTGRSRNDQVVLDSKLYTRRRLLELRERLLPVIETLLERAGGMTEDVMSSYTHVQHAQPISRLPIGCRTTQRSSCAISTGSREPTTSPMRIRSVLVRSLARRSRSTASLRKTS
jgi:argininosuccinate lyase